MTVWLKGILESAGDAQEQALYLNRVAVQVEMLSSGEKWFATVSLLDAESLPFTDTERGAKYTRCA